MKKIVKIILVTFIILFYNNCTQQQNEGITAVSTEEMQTILTLEDAQLIDVRTEEEHNMGHLLNSQNIDYHSPTFEVDITKLDRNKPVIVYCQKGARSVKCADKMLKAGFKKVYDLKGGFSKWKHTKLNLKS